MNVLSIPRLQVLTALVEYERHLQQLVMQERSAEQQNKIEGQLTLLIAASSH
jgi:hypothetical protein